MQEREKGPVEILCKEIGFRFAPAMETEAVLVSFVGVLLDQIEDMRAMSLRISSIPGVKEARPSDESGEVLRAARDMLTVPDKIAAAAKVHDLTHQPDDGPCDHLIDMLSSCASAIRFGLEKPCHSRHAAAAADHIWKHRYGLRLFDEFTGAWCKDWTRAQLQTAILRMALGTTQMRQALEFIREKAADKRNPQMAFVADKALKGEPLSPLRSE